MGLVRAKEKGKSEGGTMHAEEPAGSGNSRLAIFLLLVGIGYNQPVAGSER